MEGLHKFEKSLICLFVQVIFLLMYRVCGADMPLKTFYTPSIINSIAFSPDSSIIAIGLVNGNILLWNVSEGSTIKELDGHAGSIETLEFSSDGKILVSSGPIGNVIFWEISTGNKIKSFQCKFKTGQSVDVGSALSPDGKLLATLFPAEPNVYELTIWDIGKQEPLTTIKRWGLLQYCSA